MYLAARNESKAVATIGKLEREGLGPGNGQPIFHKLDLANPESAKESGEAFLKREDRLDILSMLQTYVLIPLVLTSPDHS